MGGFVPLGAVQRPGEPGGTGDQLAFNGVLGLEVVAPLLDAAVQLLGIFLGKDQIDGLGSWAVLEGIEPRAGLAAFGLAPGALLSIAAIGFDWRFAGHGCILRVGNEWNRGGVEIAREPSQSRLNHRDHRDHGEVTENQERIGILLRFLKIRSFFSLCDLCDLCS
jgi:hypothetical protein